MNDDSSSSSSGDSSDGSSGTTIVQTNSYPWSAYGRWVVVIICIAALIFFFFIIGIINRRRTKKGQATIPFTNFYPLTAPPPYTAEPEARYNSTIHNPMPPMSQAYRPPPTEPPTVPAYETSSEFPPPAYPEAAATSDAAFRKYDGYAKLG
ncbi:Cell wall organization protein [Schizosaccharomyces pombe]|uniref:Uncharacterized protein C19C7.05 n=1 Tax=Schizosaccharomyces pombe (strain 972 / ATCC 24843) TaxID=284812 RepID=YHY5_SCHPO|nr:uncharacterized protein SPBC19C7.05 [Schizosaccharomyces pombe]O60154.1 RecName: Full=Uncharacterized protein C19C7.05 [Schizosaccharomyces pombe 972h-]CAA19573.1 cell wall organization protein (predicted) [Schizosaccharomyces pombe]|eukprot:NP_596161.1 uncharacterized protein SPBC19C7.05 [Schizosaccharomyces pombe]